MRGEGGDKGRGRGRERGEREGTRGEGGDEGRGRGQRRVNNYLHDPKSCSDPHDLPVCHQPIHIYANLAHELAY